MFSNKIKKPQMNIGVIEWQFCDKYLVLNVLRAGYGISVSGEVQDFGRSPRRCCCGIAGTMAQICNAGIRSRPAGTSRT